MKQAAAERATLEEQLNTALRLKDEMQVKIEELTKANQGLTARAASLEQALAADKQKLAQLVAMAAKAQPKATTKGSAKSVAKAPGNKKSAQGTTTHPAKKSGKVPERKPL